MSDAPPPRSPRPPSSTENKVVSAARKLPTQPPAPSGGLSERLQEGATETALNAVGAARDAWEGFQNTDRFFKFKVLIVSTWFILSVFGFAVACPDGHVGGDNQLSARLVVAGDTGAPVFMIVNDGATPWHNVTVRVNQVYTAAVVTVPAQGSITLTAKQLVGPGGVPAPASMHVNQLELHTAHGQAELVHDGELPQ